MTQEISPRVKAFCDWLDSLPPGTDFSLRPEFRFYAGLSDAEIQLASQEMRRRASADTATADRLSDEHTSRELFEGAIEEVDVSDLDLAKVVRLADLAETGCTDRTVAAEMLMAAAGRLLLRDFPPASVQVILERIMDGAREAFREARA
jgi:hypothetical protein